MRSDALNRVNRDGADSAHCNAMNARAGEGAALRGEEVNRVTGSAPFHTHGSGAPRTPSRATHRRTLRTSLLLVDLVESVKRLENKAKTHNRVGTGSTDSRSAPGSLGRSVPRSSPRCPDNPRAREDTSENHPGPAPVGAGVRRLRVGTALPPAPAPILSDHAVATWLQPAPFGCDNPPTRQPVRSVPSGRSGGSVGDGGGGKENPSVPAGPPLHLHGGREIRATRSLGVCTQ